MFESQLRPAKAGTPAMPDQHNGRGRQGRRPRPEGRWDRLEPLVAVPVRRPLVVADGLITTPIAGDGRRILGARRRCGWSGGRGLRNAAVHDAVSAPGATVQGAGIATVSGQAVSISVSASVSAAAATAARIATATEIAATAARKTERAGVAAREATPRGGLLLGYRRKRQGQQAHQEKPFHDTSSSLFDWAPKPRLTERAPAGEATKHCARSSLPPRLGDPEWRTTAFAPRFSPYIHGGRRKACERLKWFARHALPGHPSS
jgi:hypothetical protein